MVPPILSKINSQAQKKALKVEAVVEEHPHIILRESTSILKQILYAKIGMNISRAAISVVTSSVKKV